ncbi:MAG: nucleoside transporter C-terminal domain-containing protein [Phycisphaerae bacterium]|jgi:CNT family concentrative nucleoside transporter|nr:nucleoside transporter C-terminal domain-containing protein [Phycisphaerae bacterium]
MDRYNLISLLGIFGLMVIAWALSTNRRRVNFRVIVWGVGLQLALGVLVFLVLGRTGAFDHVGSAVTSFFNAAMEGTKFVFGPLSDPATSNGFILGLHALPAVIFFSALMSLLYYWRVMPMLIRAFAWVFTRLMRISGAESLCVAANIFVGVESATAVRPHLAKMTRSELTTILAAGMATVAATTLFIYVGFLQESFPMIAAHLISASVLSAPAAIVLSKILVPETDQPETMGKHIELHYEKQSGAIEAIITGAMAGVKLLVGIVALLIAFLGIVGVINLILSGIGGTDFQLSLQSILAYVMYPFAILIGVPPEDAMEAGKLLGERAIVTEIPAYLNLKAAIADGRIKNPRTVVVLAYSLCGFAHVASMAIFVGGISALVPERKKDLAAVGPRALLAATLACLMTGAIAGVFYQGGLAILQAGK